MTERSRETEFRGADVEAAITAGLSQLGVSRSDVIVEVVDEGSRGLLGIGSREAVVRLTALVPAARVPGAAATDRGDSEHRRRLSVSADADVPVDTAEEEDDGSGEVAAETVRELLEKMHVTGSVTAHLSDPDDLTGRQLTVVEVRGNDLGMLIGPRGETLNSFQMIARLIAGHRLRQRADFLVDIQGYRERREQALSRLAERMAKKVAARNRSVSLEAMPPHERRIIHMALRDHEDVYTQSTGEGNRRRVRILPKREE